MGTHDTSHDGKEIICTSAPDNEIESTETDKVKGEDTPTKIDIESFEQNLTESETTKLDVGALEQNSTELEIKAAEIETENVEDDPDNENNDNSVEIDQDM